MKYDVYLKTAIEAGKAILDIYNDKSYSVKSKEDDSPLTTADLKSNAIINDNLKDLGLPILSEENKSIPYSERKDWNEFILVDPLDGTKEFIKRNGEFTVNIAIIRNSFPVFGVIYAPVLDTLYWASEERGSWKLESASEFLEADLISTGIEEKLTGKKKKPLNKVRVVASKSHFSKETEDFIHSIKEAGKEIEIVSIGSSLKLCKVAEGSADIYPRLGPTMEWDTAAGHAIAKFSGCRILKFGTDEELEYNKQSLLNPWFIVSREYLSTNSHK